MLGKGGAVGTEVQGAVWAYRQWQIPDITLRDTGHGQQGLQRGCDVTSVLEA